MKKLLLLLSFAAMIGTANAQKGVIDVTGMHIGLQGGFNSVWILNQNNYGFQELEYARTFGFSTGLALGYNFKNNMGVQVDINYATMGQDYFDISKDFSNIDVNGDNKAEKIETYRYVNLSYVQIPIQFRYQSVRTKKQIISFHAMAGPSLGFLSSADMYDEADTAFNGNLVLIPGDTIDYMVPEFAQTAGPESADAYFSGFDLGFNLAIGADIYVTEQLYITPAAKFYYGLTDINSAPTRERRKDMDVPAYTGASKNAFGGLSVGIHYLLSAK